MARLFGERVSSRIDPREWRVIWKPMPRGNVSYTSSYVASIYALFAKTIRQCIKDDGVPSCVLGYVSYGNTDATVLKLFQREVLTFPFADKSVVTFADKPRAAVGNSVNAAIKRLRSEAGRVRKALPAIEKEVWSAANRTPVLLPVRAFGGNSVELLLSELNKNVIGSPDPFAAIKKEIADFCRKFPPSRYSQDPRKYFINQRGIVFRTGGPAHGVLNPDFRGNHAVQCLPRSRLRLGATFDPAFHYDCCASRGPLPAQWTGCHGQSVSIRRQYANVYPNDYVR